MMAPSGLRIPILHHSRRWICAALLVTAAVAGIEAQSVAQSIRPETQTAANPANLGFVQQVPRTANSMGQVVSQDQPGTETAFDGNIVGTVLAPDGTVIAGATVSLDNLKTGFKETLIADNAGFFQFRKLSAGTYQLTVASAGFNDWIGPKILLLPGAAYEFVQITMQVASTSTTVTAVFAGHELAARQMKAQEKQRVLGIVPNFYTSYLWHAEPLTSGQKFQLAWRMAIDPVTFLGTGAIAGIQQWEDDFEGYGQGAQGYAKRYGASYTTGFSELIIGGAILPSILHQDPRYFYKGTGSTLSRALYAISTVAICRGDNGRWQPNYSNVFGNLAAGGISNLYYPAGDRGFRITMDNALLTLAGGAANSLFQEFLLRKISRGVSHRSKTQP